MDVADVDSPGALAGALSDVAGGGLRVVRVRLPGAAAHVEAVARIGAAVAEAVGPVV